MPAVICLCVLRCQGDMQHAGVREGELYVPAMFVHMCVCVCVCVCALLAPECIHSLMHCLTFKVAKAHKGNDYLPVTWAHHRLPREGHTEIALYDISPAHYCQVLVHLCYHLSAIKSLLSPLSSSPCAPLFP